MLDELKSCLAGPLSSLPQCRAPLPFRPQLECHFLREVFPDHHFKVAILCLWSLFITSYQLISFFQNSIKLSCLFMHLFTYCPYSFTKWGRKPCLSCLPISCYILNTLNSDWNIDDTKKNSFWMISLTNRSWVMSFSPVTPLHKVFLWQKYYHAHTFPHCSSSGWCSNSSETESSLYFVCILHYTAPPSLPFPKFNPH